MRELKVLTGKHVVVATPDADVDGIIESATRDTLTLVEAALVGGAEPVEIPGRILIPIRRICYVRVP